MLNPHSSIVATEAQWQGSSCREDLGSHRAIAVCVDGIGGLRESAKEVSVGLILQLVAGGKVCVCVCVTY